MQADTPLIISIFMMIFAGVCEGTAETLKFHPDSFFHVFRRAKKEFWHPDISWLNKYKDGNPSNGPKFWQSTKSLVSLTDGYHLVRLIRNWFIILAIIISPSLPAWYMYVAAFILLYLAFTVGFSLLYDHLFGYIG